MSEGHPVQECGRRPPIRILEVVDSLDVGGMERQLVGLANRLNPSEFQFEFCCLRHPGVFAARLSKRHRLHHLNKPEGFHWRTSMRLNKLVRAGFNLIHTHNLGALIYASIATVGGRVCPILHGEHAQFTPEDASFRRLWQRRILFRFCKAIHTVSSTQHSEMIRAGIHHSDTRPLLNGVDAQEFRPASNRNEKLALRSATHIPASARFLIGIVGRFGHHKRHLELIEAYEQIADEFPHCYLIVIGDGGPMKERVLSRMKLSIHSDKMKWVGHQENTAPFFRMLDLLVVPSSNEGLSNVTLEALASGVPVLSNTVCGAEEIIDTGRTGWVKDLNCTEDIRRSITQAVRVPENMLTEMGTQGRMEVLRKFSSDIMTRKYSELFRCLASR